MIKCGHEPSYKQTEAEQVAPEVPHGTTLERQENPTYIAYTMAKTPKNHNKTWTNQDMKNLKDLARKNTPTGLIAYEMGRSENAIRAKANQEAVSLKPVNKSPYNRKPKK